MPTLLLNELTDLILLEVISHLSPEKISQIKLINRRFYLLAKENSLWNRKLQKHFPWRRIDCTFKLQTSEQIFIHLYRNQYYDIRNTFRILLSLMIEGDTQSLQDTLTIDELMSHLYGFNRIISYLKQSTKDFLYQYIASYYPNKSASLNCVMSSLGTNRSTEPVTLLMFAVLLSQSIDVIDDLVKHGCDINQHVFLMGDPISLAAEYNQHRVVQALLNYPHCSGVSFAFYKAVENGSVESLKILHHYLVTYKPNELNQDKLNDLLYQAAQEGQAEAARFLLEHGAMVNVKGPFGASPLSIACSFGFCKLVRVLLEYNADPNLVSTYASRNTPPIVHAARHSYDMVALLLKRGAIVNACSVDGLTALHSAAGANHYPIVRLLLEHGANVDALLHPERWKYTALTIAAEHASVDIILLLIRHGANVNHVCGNGATALLYAAQANRVDTVRVLLQHGATLQEKYQNQTALEIAKANKNKAMIDLLLPYFRCHRFKEMNAQSNHVKLSLLNAKRTTNALASPQKSVRPTL